MSIYPLLILALLLVDTIQGQGESVALQAFVDGDTAYKRQVLNRITTQTLDVRSEDVVEILRRGIADSEAGVRQRALLAIVSRAGGPRFAKAEAVTARWAAEHELIQALREPTIAALRDRASEVRLAAVLALGNMDYDSTIPTAYSLRADTLAVFLEAASKEPDARVRAEIVKGLALGPEDSPAVRALFLKGLSDEHPSVRRFAAVGAGRLRPTEVLASLGRLLRDGDSAVRVEAVKALGSFESQARSFTNELRDALALERNGLVRAELERALMRVNAKP